MNRMIVDGQIHGGIAQGLGQVLFEEAVYEEGTGQPLTGSYMDYGIPHADDLPMLDTEIRAVPSRTNPLGVKGVGEAGATGALCAGYAAVLDALASIGVREFQMPASPERLWSAIRDAVEPQQGGRP
jgi:aerobic carbon-monoxide dehydrogenase large subunit